MTVYFIEQEAAECIDRSETKGGAPFMAISLDTFEQYVDDTILERGEDYFENGSVERIDEKEKNHFTARVSGSSEYVVEVTLNESDDIVATSCNCPYDQGDFCKHQVAVFYALSMRDQIKAVDQPAASNFEKAAVHKKGKRDVQEVIKRLSKHELVSILLNIAKENEKISDYLLFRYAPKEERVGSARELVRRSINRAKRRGFIEWNRVEDALEGACTVLRMADEELKNGRSEIALLLCLNVIGPVVDMLKYSDDSGGWPELVIGDSLKKMRLASTSGQLNDRQKKVLFHEVLKEARKKRYDDWIEWRLDLLKVCPPLCDQLNLRRQFHAELMRLADSQPKLASYGKEKLSAIQLELFERYGSKEEAERFLQKHLYYTSFREHAIQLAFEKKDLARVERLCLEGEKADAGDWRNPERWKTYRLQAYEKAGNLKGQKQLMFEFLYKGEFSYYGKLKHMYGREEWETVLKKILDTFETETLLPYAYVEILKTEKLYDKMLHYCEKRPQAIEELGSCLIEEYPEKVSQLFAEWISKEADQACNRKEYRKVCSKIKTYRSVCGRACVLPLIEKLRQSNKRRPAFIDELDRLTKS